MARTFSRATTEAVLNRLPETVDTWDQVVAGDLVKVRGERGDFKFLSARVKDGDVAWLNLAGPIGERSQLRAVVPGRVTRKPGRRRKV